MTPKLQLTLFGKPSVIQDENPFPKLAYQKSLALLFYLAVTGRAHSRETLVGLLWGQSQESSAQAGLRKSLAELRTVAGDHLIIERKQVAFNTQAPYTLDVREFEKILETYRDREGTELHPAEATRLANALELYHGDFLGGFYVQRAEAFEEWVTLLRERLRLAAIQGLHTLSDHYLAQGQYTQAIQHTKRLLELEPCQEEAHRQLMSLLALSGQRELALRQYERCKDVLAEAFNMPPQGETTALYQRIRQEPEQASPAAGYPLPVPGTPLVGRQTDLDALQTRLLDPTCLLLTILGPGGSGKTHLALVLAAHILEQSPASFADGIVFVPLNALRNIEALPSAIAHQLSFQFDKESPPLHQLCAYLANRKMLLILDNFEHLIKRSATQPSVVQLRSASAQGVLNAIQSEALGTGIITYLLQRAPGIKLLVTSRARLNLQREHAYPLSGIEYPALETGSTPTAEAIPAVELFIQSAQRIDPQFISHGAALAEIIKICQQVRGLPLGILLASGWSGLLSPGEIAARLSAESGIDLLESEAEDFPRRQRSLRAVLAYSWKLLSASDQATLAALSMFRGNFSLEAAQQVAGARLGELRTLNDHSLLQRTAEGRYIIHEFTRQFAQDEMANPAEVRARYLNYYAAKLSAWAVDIQSERQIEAIEDLDLEIENARAAWDWAIANDNLDFIDQAMQGFYLYYDWRYRFPDGLSVSLRLVDYLQVAEDNPEIGDSWQVQRLLARALAWQGVFGPTDKAEALLRQSLAILDKLEDVPGDLKAVHSERAFMYWHLARVISQTGNHTEARHLYEQSGVLYQALGDRWGLAYTLMGLGSLLWDQSAYVKASQFLESSLTIQREIGDQRGAAASLSWLGLVRLFQGQIEGEQLVRESLDIYAALGDHMRIFEGIELASIALMVIGRFEEARQLITEMLRADASIVFRQDSIHALLASTLIHLGQVETAREHAQRGVDLARRLGDPYGVGFALVTRGWLALVDGELDSALALFSDSAKRCQQHGLSDVYSWALASQGFTEKLLGRAKLAHRHLAKALYNAQEFDNFVGKLFSLTFICPLLSDLGQSDLAIELYAAMRQYPMVENSTFFGDLVGTQIELLAARLPSDIATQAKARGQSLELDEVVTAVLKALGDC